jgi:LysM repeat protein
MAEVRMHMPEQETVGSRRSASRQDGLVGLYASRLDAQRAQRMTTGRTLQVARSGQSRPCTIVRGTAAVGRGAPEHYRRLYPGQRPELRRLRGGGAFMNPLPSSHLLSERVRAVPAGLGIAAWRSAFRGAMQFPRFAAPRRLVMASLAALIIVAGAATSGLAQQRYEVQPGETLESVAAKFGVDADGIRRSSYMPNGDVLSAGQVIVIPDQGQSPADAAAMAAQLEGTSPWVMDAHWVEFGDTLGSIGAIYGVAPEVLASFNGIADPASILPADRILIPYEREDQTASTTVHNAPQVVVPIANYTQSRNLSCEFAAA